MQHSKIIALFFVTLLALNARSSLAQVTEITLWGLSHHLGSSYAGAPRGLDDEGKTVFNPGLGLVLDNRATMHSEGFSLIAQAGYFQDCDARGFFYGGAGARYQKNLNSFFSLGMSASLAIANAEKWSNNKRQWLIIPFPLLEGKFHFEKYTIGIFSGFSPRNKKASATSGGDLIFTGMNIGI